MTRLGGLPRPDRPRPGARHDTHHDAHHDLPRPGARHDGRLGCGQDARHRARRRTSGAVCARALVGAALVCALVLSPWEPLLPHAAPRLGAPHAGAQVDGDLDPVGPGQPPGDPGQEPGSPQPPTPGDECASVPTPGGDSDGGIGVGVGDGDGGTEAPGDGEPSDDDEPASAVACGTPDACPSDPDDVRPWEADPNDPSLCLLTTPVCPESPLQPTGGPVRYTVPYDDYADFCADPIRADETAVIEYQGRSARIFQLCKGQGDAGPGLVLPGHPKFTRTMRSINTSEGTVRVCNAIVPSSCPEAMHHVSLDGGLLRCRQYQRRFWHCPEGSVPRNQFNSCYRQAADADADADADSGLLPCGTAAPRFAISNCEVYVSDDYSQTPSCDAYGTGGHAPAASRLMAHSNDFWCSYDPRWLGLACHGDGSSCGTPAPARSYCIKRASETGGCASVASTIRCRALQARLLHARNTEADSGDDVQQAGEDVQREGCAACVILPFLPVGSDAADANNCPPIFSRHPDLPSQTQLKDTLRRQGSIDSTKLEQNSKCKEMESDKGRLHDPRYDACRVHKENELVPCSTPTLGQPELRNATESVRPGVPVIVEFADSADLVVGNHFKYTFHLPSGKWRGELRLVGRQALLLAGQRNRIVAQWPKPRVLPTDPQTALRNRPGDVLVSGGGECFGEHAPLVRLMVDELWPDIDREEIKRLFGADSLQAWDGLEPQQQVALTAARGMSLYDPPTDPADARQAEEDEREARRPHNIRVDCSTEVTTGQPLHLWCRWIPERPGYFRLTAETAWILRRFGTPDADGGQVSVASLARDWISPTQWDQANTYLADNVKASDGNCPDSGEMGRLGMSYRSSSAPELGLDDADCIIEDLERLGVTAAQAGFEDDIQGLLPLPEGSENARQNAMFRGAAPHVHRCPSQDVRILCRVLPSNRTFAYGTTDSIGVVVYEARVVTRQPSGTGR